MNLQPEAPLQKTLIKNILIDQNIAPEEVVSLGKYHILVGNLHIKGIYSRKIPNIQLSKLDGSLVIEDSRILWLFPNLKNVTGNVIVKNSYVTGFENLANVFGDFKAKNSTVVHMHNLKKVAGNVVLDNSDIIHALTLETIGKDLFLNDSTIIHAPDLRYVNGKEFSGEPGISITKSFSQTEGRTL